MWKLVYSNFSSWIRNNKKKGAYDFYPRKLYSNILKSESLSTAGWNHLLALNDQIPESHILLSKRSAFFKIPCVNYPSINMIKILPEASCLNTETPIEK